MDPGVVGGFALMRVRSKEEAISWCDKFATVIGDVELFLGPVVEPWDLGMMPKPQNESKELIAGYAILDLPSKAAAIEWAMRFGDVVKVNEVDVRRMPE